VAGIAAIVALLSDCTIEVERAEPLEAADEPVELADEPIEAAVEPVAEPAADPVPAGATA
jgi:hypothetical protein